MTEVIIQSADPDALDWRDAALCAQVDPEAFYPEKGGSVLAAKRTCCACEVRAECLEYALATNQTFGVWGGMSEFERKKLRRTRMRAQQRSPA